MAGMSIAPTRLAVMRRPATWFGPEPENFRRTTGADPDGRNIPQKASKRCAEF
ncbi:MAG TPA: hypothetical protein VNR11_07030 [Xanthobacteraceae bacterium]|nr:hypothetical protein [Xanthobacteraceae bacterium]